MPFSPPIWPWLLSKDECAVTRLVVEGAQELIRSPARWTRKVLARDARGNAVRPDDPRAARYCLSGAMLRVAHEQLGTELRYPKRRLKAPLKGDPRVVLAYEFVGVIAALSLRFESADWTDHTISLPNPGTTDGRIEVPFL